MTADLGVSGMRVRAEEFGKFVSRASQFVSNTASIPEFRRTVLWVEGGRVNAGSTNLEQTIRVTFGGTVEGLEMLGLEEPQCFDPKEFVNALALFPQMVNLNCDKARNSLHFTDGSRKASVPAMADVGHPAINIVNTNLTQFFDCPAKNFGSALKSAMSAASTDDTRPILTGICVEVIGDKLSFVTTDTHRLLKCSIKDATGYMPKQIIIPAPAALVLTKLCPDDGVISCAYDGNGTVNRIVFFLGGDIIESRVIDGTFPRIERVIPSTDGDQVEIQVPTSDFAATLRRIRPLMANAQMKDRIILSFTPEGNFFTFKDLVEVTAPIDCLDVKLDKGVFEAAMNITYLIEIAGACPSEKMTLFSHGDVLQAMRIESQTEFGFVVGVVMPMQVW